MDITQTKLAALAGVSQNTVHRALHGMGGVSEKTRKVIHELASTHGCRLNSAARNMRTGRTGQVGVLVLDSPAHSYIRAPLLELTWGINAGLEAGGFVTTLVRLNDVDRPDAENAKIFREHLLDGVVVANMLPGFLEEKVRKLVPRHVWLDTDVWEPTLCLQRDEELAGRLAARALIAAGHRRLVYFVRPEAKSLHGEGSMTHYSGAARMRGLHLEAEAAGVDLIPYDVPEIEDFDTAALEKLLRDGAGLFARRMSEARGIAAHTLSGKFSGQWGRDFSIASADDGADFHWWWPELARVSFDRVAMGRRAADMMVALLNGDGDDEPEQIESVRIAGEFHAGSTIRKM